MNRSQVRGLWPALLLLPGCLTAPAGPSEGRPAPALEGSDTIGRPLRLSDHRGQVVLVDFFRAG
jgi:hypothetical protein